MAQEKWIIAEGQTRIIDVERVTTLRVSLVGGTVDIIAHDEPTTRVEIHAVSGRELRVNLDGDTLDIDQVQLRWDNLMTIMRSFPGNLGKTQVSVLVPRSIALTLGVVGAQALVSGITGDATLNTVSGELQVESHRGDLNIHSVSGEVNLSDHTGAVHVQTVSGEVTAAGHISSFGAESVSASMYLDAFGEISRISTKSVGGGVTIRLDPDLGARYSVNTVSGALHIDGQTIGGNIGRNFSSATPGSNATEVMISANSVTGNLSVVRRAEDGIDS